MKITIEFDTDNISKEQSELLTKLCFKFHPSKAILPESFISKQDDYKRDYAIKSGNKICTKCGNEFTPKGPGKNFVLKSVVINQSL